MLKQALVTVVALTGLAFSAPAQLHIHGQLGRHVQVSAHIGGDRHHYPTGQHYPRRVVRYDDHHGRRRGHNRGRHRGGHNDGHHGYWRNVCERVWVPGGYREEYCPPRYGWVYDSCGRRVWGIVEAGGVRRIPLPGHYETRTRRVWVSY